jgi:hypothetical protein
MEHKLIIEGNYLFTENKEAHLPLNGANIIENLPLLPSIENEVEELANDMFEEHSTNVLSPQHEMRKMFMYGYNKAKEKYKYTDEDIMSAMKRAVKYYSHMWDDSDGEKIIQSLQQPKMPIGFESDMEYRDMLGYWYKIDEITKESINRFGLETRRKTTTNSQGQNVWVGKYIYETNNA